MLRIKQEQLDILDAVAWRRFESELIERLRENFASTIEAHHFDEAGLKAIIRRGVDHAAKYEIRAEYDVIRFIEYAFEYGGGFETLPWASPVLNSPDLTGDDKMDRLDAISAFALR